MYPRWQPANQTAPPRPASRIAFGTAPALDLETQLNAELDGASWAVIASARKDAPWVDWLYRHLNGFPVPVAMIGSATSPGLPRPDCVSIFPDPRDPQQAAHAARALEKSGYLVVVCSPYSAHCPEVDAQICAFKSAGGEERIIALVVESGPDGALENAPKTVAPEWLPAWLRWRLADDVFGTADGGEPRIVDARPGRTSLKEVRDNLLAALLDVDAWELDVVGGLSRPVECGAAAKPSACVPAVASPQGVARPRKTGSLILAAAICAGVTLGTAWWSFGRIETDRERTLAAPVRVTAAKKTPPAPVPAAPPVVAAENFAPAPEPAAAPDVVAVPAPSPAQVAVAAVPATQQVTAIFSPAPAEESAARSGLIALHHRGDVAVGERRLDEALRFYEEAVENAGATAPNAPPEAKAEAALLCRKLGTLQLQMASTAEARASFVQGRKLLLQLKSHGQLNRERAKVLAEIETSLRRLPRD